MKKEIKYQIPDNPVERFIGVVQSIIEPMGIDKIPEVMHYVELLLQAANRHVFEEDNPSSTHHRTNIERRKFITIFNQRYLQITDLEYMRAVNPAEGKLIGQVVKQLEENGFTTEEYLQWAFDVFLSDSHNQKFLPPTIKFVCSSFIIDKFMYDNREVVKQRRDAEIRKKESLDLIGRARTLMREAKEVEDNETHGKVVEMLTKYRDQVYNVMTFRQMLEQAEKTHKQAEQAKGGSDGDGCSTNSGGSGEGL